MNDPDWAAAQLHLLPAVWELQARLARRQFGSRPNLGCARAG